MPRRDFGLRRDDYIQVEKDIQRRIGKMPLDFSAMAVVGNIYRVASAARYHLEQKVLARYRLSWTAFVALWVLWIWGKMESRHLAAESNVTTGTLTGVVNTLEKRGLCSRIRHTNDRRLVTVMLTKRGLTTIRALFPRFNREEAFITSGLNESTRTEVAHALRTMIRTLQSPPRRARKPKPGASAA